MTFTAVPAPLSLVPADAEAITITGFTQDDVDGEAHFTTPSGPGWILAFRPDVDTDQHLVSVGAAGPGVDTWGTIEGITELTSDAPAESTYYRAGCVPLRTALGPDADSEDQEAVVDAHDPGDLLPLSVLSVSFTDGLAAARVAAVTATLTDLLPFAVCNEVQPMEEPIGL